MGPNTSHIQHKGFGVSLGLHTQSEVLGVTSDKWGVQDPLAPALPLSFPLRTLTLALTSPRHR